MTVRYFFAAALLASVASAPAAAQDHFLGKVLGMLTRPAAPKGAAAVPAAVPATTVKPTGEQVAALQKALAARQLDSSVAANVAEAKPLIERLAQTGACAIDSAAWNAFNREAVTPKTWLNGLYGYVPRHNDPYHDPRYCLVVLRISAYEKPAANALSFRVYYISPQSQRAVSQPFTILKTPEGAWQVKEIGAI